MDPKKKTELVCAECGGGGVEYVTESKCRPCYRRTTMREQRRKYMREYIRSYRARKKSGLSTP